MERRRNEKKPEQKSEETASLPSGRPNEVIMLKEYIQVVSLLERLHRYFLELVTRELDGFDIHDINNIQALMLFNIGDAEMTTGELILRGCYLGSNVSYNVKKMVESGYLVQKRSEHDRRSLRVHLTDKGRRLRDRLTLMHQRHAELLLAETAITEDDLSAVTTTLRRLEILWISANHSMQRPRQAAV